MSQKALEEKTREQKEAKAKEDSKIAEREEPTQPYVSYTYIAVTI